MKVDQTVGFIWMTGLLAISFYLFWPEWEHFIAVFLMIWVVKIDLQLNQRG